MYEIKIWETEEEREMGESFVYETVDDLKYAIFLADKIYNSNDIACVEVQDIDNENETVHHRSVD